MHKTLLLAFLGLWTTSVRAHGGTRCTLRACTCIAATCLGHPPLIFGCPSQSCRRPTHVDVRPRATKPTGRRTARRCESRHDMHMCARAHLTTVLCPPTLQFGGFAPNVIIGEPDGSDSAPSNDIVCNGRSRGGVVAQTVTAGQTFGVPPLCAPRQQAPPKLLPHPARSGPKRRTRIPNKRLARPRHINCPPQCRAELQVTMAAPHPGDCGLYISYDGDDVTDANKL